MIRIDKIPDDSGILLSLTYAKVFSALLELP